LWLYDTFPYTDDLENLLFVDHFPNGTPLGSPHQTWLKKPWQRGGVAKELLDGNGTLEGTGTAAPGRGTIRRRNFGSSSAKTEDLQSQPPLTASNSI